MAPQRRLTGAGAVLRWLKTVVVSDREKAHMMRQVGTRKTYQKRSAGVIRSGVAVEASKDLDGIETEGPPDSLGTSLEGARVLARRCPAHRRREPGLRLWHGT